MEKMVILNRKRAEKVGSVKPGRGGQNDWQGSSPVTGPFLYGT